MKVWLERKKLPKYEKNNILLKVEAYYVENKLFVDETSIIWSLIWSCVIPLTMRLTYQLPAYSQILVELVSIDNKFNWYEIRKTCQWSGLEKNVCIWRGEHVQ